MRARWRRFVCRLRGHDPYGFMPWGGLPWSDTFGVRSSCRRCSADTSVAMPSRFTIFSDRGTP